MSVLENSRKPGSSPLTRGKLVDGVNRDRAAGLIPAHAGKTSSPRSPRPRRPAHPCSCEENSSVDPVNVSMAGSSPLTRGKLIPVQGRFLVERLIPAHARKTKNARRPCQGRWAHPRSRGENTAIFGVSSAKQGSSPLMRGKLLQVAKGERVHGLTPAHAGKTASRTTQSYCGRAHSRSRGENDARVGGLAGVAGSSPLMRGKLLPEDTPLGVPGLIPAHAGKTARRRRTLCSRRAHPRSCGDNFRDTLMPALWSGSSPLTQGKRCMILPTDRPVRLIPAHAGKTRLSVISPLILRAHPRSRGENFVGIRFS